MTNRGKPRGIKPIEIKKQSMKYEFSDVRASCTPKNLSQKTEYKIEVCIGVNNDIWEEKTGQSHSNSALLYNFSDTL
jgi:hypothetical protein